MKKTRNILKAIKDKKPRGRPRVLDKEVVNDILNIIIDSEDIVVKLNTPVFGEDTRVVVLEGILIGFDGNRKGLFHESSFHLSTLILWDICAAEDSTKLIDLDVFTSTIFNSVGIS